MSLETIYLEQLACLQEKLKALYEKYGNQLIDWEEEDYKLFLKINEEIEKILSKYYKKKEKENHTALDEMVENYTKQISKKRKIFNNVME